MMEEFLAAGMHWRIFNFVVFLGVLFFVLRKPVGEFWRDRSRQIRSDIDESTHLFQESKVRHDHLKKRLTGIEEEIGKLVRSIEQEGDLEKRRMIEEGDALSKRIRHESERIAEQELKRARETLKAQAVQLSVEMADRILRDNFREEDQKRISERHLKELERGAL